MSNLARLTTLKAHELLTGRHVLARLEELNRTQWMPYDELMTLQRRKLQRVISYAYQYVPYYRRLFDKVGFHPDDLSRDLDRFLQLPFLTKDLIREHFDELQTTAPARRRQLSSVTTSGSTGHLSLIHISEPPRPS
jgi:phenylacetate-CoA ligase